MTKGAFADALAAMEHALARDPACGLAWSMLGNLYAHNHTLGFVHRETPLEEAVAFARKGAAMEPRNQYARAVLAAVNSILGDKESFLEEAETAFDLNPNSPALVGFIGWLMVMYGESDRGMVLLKKGMRSNPYYPGYFHTVSYLDCYSRQEYEEALQQAMKINMPDVFWDPMLRAAALGRLGRERKARAAIDELLELRPDFPVLAPTLIGYYVKNDALNHALLDGLRKAGLRD